MSAHNIGASGRSVTRFSLCAADPTQCPGHIFFKSPNSSVFIAPCCYAAGSYTQRAGA